MAPQGDDRGGTGCPAGETKGGSAEGRHLRCAMGWLAHRRSFRGKLSACWDNNRSEQIDLEVGQRPD